jgi:hypothetical protein
MGSEGVGQAPGGERSMKKLAVHFALAAFASTGALSLSAADSPIHPREREAPL